MLRRSLLIATAVAVFASLSADLTACGDKFVRAGRSARAKGYAAVHPASILIYKPNASAKGLREFESMLRKAGHKPVALMDRAALSRTLAAAKYDVIIADYAETGTIKDQFRADSAKPGVLPILHNGSKAQETEVAKEYHCVIKPEKMTKYDALEEIDHMMEMRLKGVAVK